MTKKGAQDKPTQAAQASAAGASAEHTNQQEFIIQKLYVKDSSFESPHSPDVFRHEWKPKLTLDLNVNSNKLDENTHHVVLTVTSTVSNNDKTAFLAEVNLAGIFTIKNFTDEQMRHVLGSYCPSLMFPYARETITNLVERGGFPPLYLAPINFDALYAQEMQKQGQAKTGKSDSDKSDSQTH